jgi:hypothetical protein
MHHWERDLVDHLVPLMMLAGEAPLDAAVETVKSEFPTLPSDDAVRGALQAAMLPRHDG